MVHSHNGILKEVLEGKLGCGGSSRVELEFDLNKEGELLNREPFGVQHTDTGDIYI